MIERIPPRAQYRDVSGLCCDAAKKQKHATNTCRSAKGTNPHDTLRESDNIGAQRLVERRARRRMDSDTVTGKPPMLTRVRSN
jgi:hypothetical protein